MMLMVELCQLSNTTEHPFYASRCAGRGRAMRHGGFPGKRTRLQLRSSSVIAKSCVFCNYCIEVSMKKSSCLY